MLSPTSIRKAHAGCSNSILAANVLSGGVKMLHHKVENAQVKINSFFVGTPPPSCALVPAASARIVPCSVEAFLLP
jgi:hypothetical protein